MSSNSVADGRAQWLDFLSEVDHDVRAHLHHVMQEIESARCDGIDGQVGDRLTRIDEEVALAAFALDSLRVHTDLMLRKRSALRTIPISPAHLVNSVRRLQPLARNGSKRAIEIVEALDDIAERVVIGERRLLELALLRIVKAACAASRSGPVRIHFSGSRRSEILIRVEYAGVIADDDGETRDRLKDFAELSPRMIDVIEAILDAHHGKVRVHLEPAMNLARCLVWLPLKK